MIVNLLNKFGIDIKRYPNRDLRRREKLYKHYNITDIIDVGANFGQYGSELRKIGYKGNIFSFEPLSEAFKTLNNKSKKDPKWEIFNFALGEYEEEKEINVSQNFVSSSFLEMKNSLKEQEPTTQYLKKEIVKIKKLDSIFNTIISKDSSVFLKIDTQGYEKHVLNGSEQSISKIKGIQLEMSLNPMYENSTPFIEMYDYIISKGFKLFSIENGFFNNETGQLNEIEGIFFRENEKIWVLFR